MKIDVSYQIQKGTFYIKKINDIEYIYCNKPESITSDSSKNILNLKHKIHPSLKAFIDLKTTDNFSICNYCEKYGLLFTTKDYLNLLANSININERYKKVIVPSSSTQNPFTNNHFTKPYTEDLFPNIISNGIAMPLSLFIYYKKIFDNIIELFQCIKIYQQHSLQPNKNELFTNTIESFLNLLFKPYYMELPHPYNHHIMHGNTSLLRFSQYFSEYINTYCTPKHNLKPNEFLHISKSFFDINNEYLNLNRTLRILISNNEFIDKPYLQTSFLYDNDTNILEIDILSSYAQDMLSEEYKTLFIDIISPLRKDFELKIDKECNFHLKTVSPLPESYTKIMNSVIEISKHLIYETLSSFTEKLTIIPLTNEFDTSSNSHALLSINNLLQFLSINMIDMLPRSEIRICKYKGCNKPILTLKNDNSLKNNCCSEHYEAYQKSEYRKHNKK